VRSLRRGFLVLAVAMAVAFALLQVGDTQMAEGVRARIRARNEARQRYNRGPFKPRPPQRPVDHYLRPFRGPLIVMAVPGLITAGALVLVRRRRSRP